MKDRNIQQKLLQIGLSENYLSSVQKEGIFKK